MSENSSDKYKPKEVNRSPGGIASDLISSGVVGKHLTGLDTLENLDQKPIDISFKITTSQQPPTEITPIEGSAIILPFRKKK